MAAVANVPLVKVSINDVEIEVPKGELIVESVKRLGLEIPIFCYHPRMKPVGMCRMCLVEVGFKQQDGSVRKMPKPQAGCTLPASEGMVVYTDTEPIHADRRGVLEFLLINHPLDCPICDRGGECPLQNNTMAYGPSTSRFIELKRHLPKAFPLSTYVTLDLERCIQCGRCVRFTEEISGDHDLAFRFRGADMQPSTFQLTDFESKFSGNVIEICPVGALTSAKYRFRARPWDLETTPSVCTVCSNGCNVWFDHRAGKFVRINGRANEAVNEEWTCDKGKFGHEHYNAADRPTQPLVRQGDGFAPTSWSGAYDPVLAAFAEGGDRVAALVGPRVSNEALFLLRRLFERAFKSARVSSNWRRTPGSGSVQGTIADVESGGPVLVFGTSLADDLPIVHLRLRKGATNAGARVVNAFSRPTEVDRFAAVSLHYRPGSELALARGLHGLLAGTGATAEAVEAETGVPADRLREAVEVLKEGGTALSSQGLYDLSDGPQIVEALAGIARATGGRSECWATGANEQGAIELGLAGEGATATLQACAEGRVKALWLVAADPFALHPDRALVERALETVEFLVVQSPVGSEALAYASVVLPTALPAEQDGTYTNCERRVQRVQPAVPPPGDGKPDWRVFSECLLRALPETPLFNPREVMEAIAAEVPAFAGCRYEALGPEGTVLGGNLLDTPDEPAMVGGQA